jgi:hypothetical protein
MLTHQSNRLDQEQLVEVIMAKSKSANNARQYYPSFWQDVGTYTVGATSLADE